MSNQVSLMLSFIFLSLFIVFSGEVLAYQQISAKTLSLTTEIAVHIEKNGYDEVELKAMKYYLYFDKVDITYANDDVPGYVRYDIVSHKKYTSFSKIYDYLNKDIVCKLSVYRKE